jgi:hypothetical protein
MRKRLPGAMQSANGRSLAANCSLAYFFPGRCRKNALSKRPYGCIYHAVRPQKSLTREDVAPYAIRHCGLYQGGGLVKKESTKAIIINFKEISMTTKTISKNMNCAYCPVVRKICRRPDGKGPPACPTIQKTEILKRSLEHYHDDDGILDFARQASIQEGEGYADFHPPGVICNGTHTLI